MTTALADAPEPAATSADPGATVRRRWTIPHVPALDGLRGAAVLAVLLFHGGHLAGGYLGVDLFFVLSGFLITSLLLAEHRGAGAIALRSFWARRFRRLMPALLVMLVGVCAYAVTIARPVDLGTIRGDGYATLLYVANWHTILQGTSYWDLALAPSPLQHAWSLAIEEQFYLLWPAIVVGLCGRGRGAAGRVWRVASIGAAASAIWFLALHAWGASDTRVYEGTDTRAMALLAGAALAAWRAREAREPKPLASWGPDEWTGEAFGAAAAAILLALWFLLPGTSPWLYRGGLPAASLLAVIVVATASRAGSPIVGWACSIRPLRALGLISYGLYLWHWPIYVAVDARNGRLPLLGDRVLSDPALLGLKLGLSLAVALLSYHVVERPIRRGFPPPPASLAAAGAGFVLVAGLLAWSTADAVEAPSLSSVRGTPAAHVDGGPRVVFAGDSVAVSLFSIVAGDPARYGINPIERAVVGCSISYAGVDHRNADGNDGETPPSCAPAVLADADATGAEVVYFLTGARPNDYAIVDGVEVRACDPAFDERYEAELTAVVEELHRSVPKVVLGTVLHSSSNAFRYEGSEERIDCMNESIAAVAADVPGTAVVDQNELLCADGAAGECIEELDGGPVRSEGLHFDDGPGGQAVAAWTVDRVLDAADLDAAPGTPPAGGS